MLNSAQVNLILVFFIYGLAFFSMGLALMLESGRSPLLAEARVLVPLALFGFLHGFHEWLEMVLQAGSWLGFQIPGELEWLRLAVLVASFGSLIGFGLLSLRPQGRLFRSSAYSVLGLFGIYVGLIVLNFFDRRLFPGDWISSVDILARYLLAIPGSILAVLALSRQSVTARNQQRLRLASSLGWAAAGFGIYAGTQLFVPAVDTFPANFVNATAFYNWFGVPIQALRAMVAIVITVSLIRAMQAVEDERQKEFLNAQQARLDALEQVRRDLFEREALRHELLRHTVLSQEEERTRIARELHDETSQILAAFSLNLATLHELVPSDPRVGEILARLQALNRRMSQGIYHLMHDLRPAQLDDLGLAAALDFLAEDMLKSGGLQVAVTVSKTRQRLEPLVETVLFRVAQEALTNVSRHAGVSQAKVNLVFTRDKVTLRVCDEGVGFDLDQRQLPPHGWGLAGMHERADSVGGQLNVDSAPGRGTQVEVIVPINALNSAQIKARDSSPVAEQAR